MAIKFYFDVHIPTAVADQLRIRGVDVVRCQELGMHDASDVEHLERAVLEERTLVSVDSDYYVIAHDWMIQGRNHCGIIRILPEDQNNVGKIVKSLDFLYKAIEGGAAQLESDVFNTIQNLS